MGPSKIEFQLSLADHKFLGMARLVSPTKQIYSKYSKFQVILC